MSTTSTTGPCRVVANITLSLDGRIHGAAGPHDMGWLVPHALSDGARDHMIQVTAPATTVLLGRRNYEGFSGFWPAVAHDEAADPRDRAFSRWLDETEKIVFSTTLPAAEWKHATVTSRPPAEVVTDLRHRPGGDIIVLASASIIRQLLEADAVDRLSITLCPETVGAGGAPLFDDDVRTGGSWSLADHTVSGRGALVLCYDRAR